MSNVFGDSPSYSPPPMAQPAPLPKIDQAELARQQRSLERKRKGRRSLRIDVGLSSGTAGAGLRLPQANNA